MNAVKQPLSPVIHLSLSLYIVKINGLHKFNLTPLKWKKLMHM